MKRRACKIENGGSPGGFALPCSAAEPRDFTVGRTLRVSRKPYLQPQLQRPCIPALALLLLLGLSAASAQQRVEFERKPFDRSRFQRNAPQPADAPEPAPAPLPPSTNAAPAYAPPVDPALAALVATPALDALPNRWHTHPRDHDELLQLQKETGACLLIYFKDVAHPQQKGLCSWYERAIAADVKWRRAMRNYLRLEIVLPGNNAARDLAAAYRATHTPALFVRTPNSTLPKRLMVFKFETGKRPEPIDVETVLDDLKARSTPAYQNLF
jgi:hypothetical protein